MVKRFILALCLLQAGTALFAGDIANFVNLGFSDDSRYFMFGQYGILTEGTRGYAEIYTVDVAKNEFVPRGVKRKVFDEEIQPGQDGSGALFVLLHESAELVKRYQIHHLKTGRLVYLFINGETPRDRIEFRDFLREDSLVVTLNQQSFGTGREVSASFHINLSVTSRDGKTTAHTIGLPNFRRPGVKRYWIQQVFFTPDERGLVFVVEKDEIDGAGKSVRHMVETVYFR